MKKAFTLIELLIVVAIIAILAAIAVPNFLEAQTRAKVSRVRADTRTIVTALESYRVDFPKYPPMSDRNAPGIPASTWSVFQDIGTGGDDHSRTPSYLTTPVAYITSIPFDPFIDKAQILGSTEALKHIGNRYVYFNYAQFVEGFPTSQSFRDRSTDAGEWLLYGIGPDREPSNYGAGVYVNYDSSNGTISGGNIFRTQKDVELFVDRTP